MPAEQSPHPCGGPRTPRKSPRLGGTIRQPERRAPPLHRTHRHNATLVGPPPWNMPDTSGPQGRGFDSLRAHHLIWISPQPLPHDASAEPSGHPQACARRRGSSLICPAFDGQGHAPAATNARRRLDIGQWGRAWRTAMVIPADPGRQPPTSSQRRSLGRRQQRASQGDLRFRRSRRSDARCPPPWRLGPTALATGASRGGPLLP